MPENPTPKSIPMIALPVTTDDERGLLIIDTKAKEVARIFTRQGEVAKEK